MKSVLSAMTAMLVGCGTSTPAPTSEPPGSLPVVVARFGEHPFWFGRSEHSPFGPMPYGLVARRDGEAIVLRGDVPPGLGLPDGSYQQFTLAGSRLDFETSLSGPIVKGRMIEQGQSRVHVTYCLPPEAGACRGMEVTFRREGEAIRFETRRDGEPHHAVVLAPRAP
ncbi:MAG: hypothetical protein IT385_21250 [Deltaproteobacteria bacterium]|nr:hypothetical protein [Deltaproteobacteria bacterium]